MSKMLKISTVIVLCANLFSPWASAHHAGGHPTRYVAQSGIDTGTCTDVKAPCKSLSYVFKQTGKGDKIHVAEGSFSLKADDIFFLLSEMIDIEGGYKVSEKFSSPHKTKTLTQISGIPAEYRDKLAAKGFHLIQDQKQISALDEKTIQELALFKKLTSQTQSTQACTAGIASGFPCENIGLQSHMPLSSFSSEPGELNDIWGFVDLNDNHEYAVIGLQNGTAVVDVTNPSSPKEIGTIPGITNIWRDIKVFQRFNSTINRYQAYAYVTTEASQGLQIIDLTQLPNKISLGNTLTDFNSAHNVYLANVDYSSGLSNEVIAPHLYIAGSNKSNGGYRVFNLDDPLHPSLIGSNPNPGSYMHDATSLVISDDRTNQCSNGHNPCELLVDFNETTVDIWDVTDQATPTRLSSTGYPNTGYTHSGWWSQDKNYIFVQDELDEQKFGLNTTLRVMDIHDLAHPFLTSTYTGNTRAIDHNGFVKNDKYYMSNYRRGLTILDIKDPTTPVEIGFFDTFPTPSSNSASFNGAWGTFPYLPSGNVLISDIEFGFFVVKPRNINNIAPVISANQQQLSMDEDHPLDIHLTDFNVLDVDSNFPEDFSLIILDGENYTVSGQTILPTNNFHGNLNVPVRVNDGNVDSNLLTLNIIVNSINDTPTAVDDSFDINENSTAGQLNVLQNDSDADNDTLTISQIDYSGASTVSNLGSSIQYNPSANFSGVEQLSYTITDPQGASSQALVTIQVKTAQSSTTESSGGGNFSLLLSLIIISYRASRNYLKQKH